MDSATKQTPSSSSSNGSYGYNSGGTYAGYSAAGYGYGYGYGAEGETAAHRTLQDYLLILRERVWYIVVVFLVVFSSALVFTLSRTKIFESTASVQIFRRDAVVMQVQGVMDNEVRSAEDLNTQVKVLESSTIIQKVAERLTGDDLRAFIAPYEKSGSEAPLVTQLLLNNRKIVPQRLSLVIQVQYDHPDPQIAAKVANLFADEYMNYNARMRFESSMRAVEELKTSAEEQRHKVDELAAKRQAYLEKNKLISLDSRKDIVNETLKQLNLNVTKTETELKAAEIRWKQVKDRIDVGRDLLDLSFISGQMTSGTSGTSLVSQLSQQLASQKIVVAKLGERYREHHPKMIEATQTLTQTQKELSKAIDAAAASVKSEYEIALRNDQAARAALDAQKAESL